MSDRTNEELIKEERQRVIDKMLLKVSIYYKTFDTGLNYADLNRLVMKQFKRLGLDLYATCIALTKDDSIRIVLGPTNNAKLFPFDADLETYLKQNPTERLMKT